MAAKPKQEVIWCDRGWFPPYYGFCPSEAAWKVMLRKLKIAPTPYPGTIDARCTSFQSPTGGLCLVVTVGEHIDKKDDRLAIICLIAHEAIHVWQAIRENIGEAEPSHELEAYAVQAILTQLAAAYSKTRRKL